MAMLLLFSILEIPEDFPPQTPKNTKDVETGDPDL